MSRAQSQRKDTVITAEPEVASVDVKRTLGELLGRVGFGGERIIITRHGRHAAALIGLKDLERLRALDAA